MTTLFKQSGPGLVKTQRLAKSNYRTPPQLGLAPSSYDYSYKIGHTIPDFHRRKRAGELLPHTGYEQFQGTANANHDYEVISNDGFMDGSFGDNWLDDTFVITAPELLKVAEENMTSAYVTSAAARATQGQFDALTFLAEWRKTVALFRDVVIRFDRLVQEGIRKGLHRTKLDFWAQLWLEFRYGWRILYYDLLSVEESLSNMNRKSKVRSFTSGRTSRSIDQSVKTYGFSSCSFDVTRVTDFEIGQRGVVSFRTELDRIEANPLNTAWELVTFSFLIDRIIDIGSYLNSLSVLFGTKSYSASMGVMVKASRSCSVTDVRWVDNYKTGGGYFNLTTSADASIVVRNPTTIPYHPQFELRLDGGILTDVLAILTVALTKKLGFSQLKWR